MDDAPPPTTEASSLSADLTTTDASRSCSFSADSPTTDAPPISDVPPPISEAPPITTSAVTVPPDPDPVHSPATVPAPVSDPFISTSPFHPPIVANSLHQYSAFPLPIHTSTPYHSLMSPQFGHQPPASDRTIIDTFNLSLRAPPWGGGLWDSGDLPLNQPSWAHGAHDIKRPRVSSSISSSPPASSSVPVTTRTFASAVHHPPAASNVSMSDSSVPAPAAAFMPNIWANRRQAVYTLRNMPLTLTTSQIIATISAQLNKSPKEVFQACLKDTRFKTRGVFHLKFTSAQLLKDLLNHGFEVGGKTIGGGKIRCFVPNFGVEYDANDARHALSPLGEVSDVTFVTDSDGIRVGGLKFHIRPFEHVLLDMLVIEQNYYDIRYLFEIFFEITCIGGY